MKLKKASVTELIKEYVLALFQPIMLFTIIAKHISETSEIDKTDLLYSNVISAIIKTPGMNGM